MYADKINDGKALNAIRKLIQMPDRPFFVNFVFSVVRLFWFESAFICVHLRLILGLKFSGA